MPSFSSSAESALTKRPRPFFAACQRSSTPDASGLKTFGCGCGHTSPPGGICVSVGDWLAPAPGCAGLEDLRLRRRPYEPAGGNLRFGERLVARRQNALRAERHRGEVEMLPARGIDTAFGHIV